MMFKEIVVGTDGSEQALQAARVAARMALLHGANVTLLSVFDMADLPLPYESLPNALPYIENRPKVGEKKHLDALQKAGTLLKELGVRYTLRRETGTPADTIVRVAQEQNADLIVLGRRGMKGVKRFLKRSILDDVLLEAHCPVLLVR